LKAETHPKPAGCSQPFGYEPGYISSLFSPARGQGTSASDHVHQMTPQTLSAHTSASLQHRSIRTPFISDSFALPCPRPISTSVSESLRFSPSLPLSISVPHPVYRLTEPIDSGLLSAVEHRHQSCKCRRERESALWILSCSKPLTTYS
jgi:hypothetical protein